MKKIAFITEDGETISQHFGRAPFFSVATLSDDRKVQLEQREKWHHGQQPGGGHGDHGGHSHETMFATIKDCQVLVAGGMGEPAYQSARQAGLEVILTGEKTISAALAAYQAGTLASDLGRVHAHR